VLLFFFDFFVVDVELVVALDDDCSGV